MNLVFTYLRTYIDVTDKIIYSRLIKIMIIGLIRFPLGYYLLIHLTYRYANVSEDRWWLLSMIFMKKPSQNVNDRLSLAVNEEISEISSKSDHLIMSQVRLRPVFHSETGFSWVSATSLHSTSSSKIIAVIFTLIMTFKSDIIARKPKETFVWNALSATS